MKQTFTLILILLSSFSFSQKSLIYEIQTNAERKDSLLTKIETYKLIEPSDSLLIQKDFYKNGILDKVIKYINDSVIYIINYNYKQHTKTLDLVRYSIINNEDTTVRIMYFIFDKNGNPYYATDFDSTNNKLMVRRFIHYDYDLNNNILFEHEFFYRNFSGYTTEGGMTKYEYDNRNRLKYVLSPDYPNDSVFERIQEYIYNKDGKLQQIIFLSDGKPTGNRTDFKYNEQNELVEKMSFFDMTELAKFLGNGSTWQKNIDYYIYDGEGKLQLVKEIMQQEFSIHEKHKIYFY